MRKTESNLAARVLFDAAHAGRLQNVPASLDTIPPDAAEAIRVWASQRGVPLGSIHSDGGAIQYDDGAVYCFRFGVSDRYNGVVCVHRDGTLLAEDSRVSV